MEILIAILVVAFIYAGWFHKPAPKRKHVMYLGELQKLIVSESDTLVLQTHYLLTLDQLNQLRENLQAEFPKNKIVLLSGDIKLGVVKHE